MSPSSAISQPQGTSHKICRPKFWQLQKLRFELNEGNNASQYQTTAKMPPKIDPNEIKIM